MQNARLLIAAVFTIALSCCASEARLDSGRVPFDRASLDAISNGILSDGTYRDGDLVISAPSQRQFIDGTILLHSNSKSRDVHFRNHSLQESQLADARAKRALRKEPSTATRSSEGEPHSGPMDLDLTEVMLGLSAREMLIELDEGGTLHLIAWDAVAGNSKFERLEFGLSQLQFGPSGLSE